MRRPKYFLALLFFLCVGCDFLIAQIPVIQYKPLATGLVAPVDIANAGDGSGRLFIVQQGGVIRIWDGVALLPTPFLDVSGIIASGGERGLLSLAFHPDYKNNRYFFIYYTRAGDGSITVSRYRTLEGNPNQADAASATVILSVVHPNGNHNGGKLAFGSDGFLYFGTGDGGAGNDPPNNAQNGKSLLGKMLRLDVNDFADTTPPLYSIPPTNPYINDEAITDEVIALGLRNPFRWSFDRSTGDMWIGDVGQNTKEEVDFRARQEIISPTNYGWRCFEGFITNPTPGIGCPAPGNYVAPVFNYGHNAAGGFVITGGYVYRGLDYPVLKGYYTCTDFATGNIWLIKRDSAGSFVVTPQTSNRVAGISSFGEAENGSLYAVQLSPGTLYKISTDDVLPLELISFSCEAQASSHTLSWIINNMKPGDLQILERRITDETLFKEVAKIIATGNEDNKSTVVALPALSNESFYRLKMIQINGDTTYSDTIRILNNTSLQNIFTANISGGYIDILLLQRANSVEVFDALGRELYRGSLTAQTGVLHISLRAFAKGVIFVKVFAGKNSTVKKLLWR
jgi:glucose/arabinose dehydrogenase